MAVDVLGMLQGGDRRSIERVDEVIAAVLQDPSQFPALFGGMLHDDALIRMRSADAVEKITSEHPDLLGPYKQQLLHQIARSDQQEVRWHVAQMLPRLALSDGERADAVELLVGYLDDESKIVKTFSMQALADLAQRDTSLKPRVVQIVEAMTHTGSPAVRSRGRKLLEALQE